MTPIIRIRNLRKSFGKKHVLCGVNLDIMEKSITAIIGQSGIGKSVLFRSIMRMIEPDAGEVWFHDTDLARLPRDEMLRIRSKFGYSFQNAALFDSMSVAENIAFPLREVVGIKNNKEIRKRVEKLLDWIELPGIGKMHPDELSGGMRKRVGIARSLAMEPEILLFDEPTTGLDPVLAETIHALVQRVNRELGITCILITHNIPGAFAISDRIAFLDLGEIVAEGDPKEITRSNHPLVREFLVQSFRELDV